MSGLRLLTYAGLGTSLVLAALMAGFFWAWDVSVMRGFAAADPELAVQAMQIVNAQIRNPAFAVGFFGTSVAAAATLIVAISARAGWRALSALIAGLLIYLVGVLGLTFAVNVPLNDALATANPSAGAAAAIWQDFAPPWLRANLVRMLAALAAMLAFAAALTLAALRFARPGASAPGPTGR